MIVKNETSVLGRLFESLKDIVEYYIIVDTGSTDGTPEFIKQKMDEYGIEGEVYCHEWVNFGFNRNQALQYVYKKNFQGWVLFIDADEEFAFSDPTFYKTLQQGTTYQLEKHHGRMRYALSNLVDVSETQWEWRGVVHEYLQHISGPNERQLMPLAWIIYHEGEGARSQGISVEEKFLRDAALLEKECAKEPADTRSKFYLAQSYHNAGMNELAYQHYAERAMMNGWEEENFIAQLRTGNIAAVLDKPYSEVVEALTKAHQMRPSRAEALHALAVYHRKREMYEQAYNYAKMATQLPLPNDRLFVERDVYDWSRFDELSVAAYWTEKYTESRDISETLLQQHQQQKIQLDDSTVQRIQDNLKFSLQKLSETQISIDSNNYAELLIATDSTISKKLKIEGTEQEFNSVVSLDTNQDYQLENERILFKKCPLCDSTNFTDYTKGNCSGHACYHNSLDAVIQWMRCTNCKHVFTKGYYTKEACELIFRETHDNQKVGFDIEQQRIISSHIIEKVLPFTSSGDWLDVGFGNGSLLFTAQEYGFKPIGIDLRSDNVKTMSSFGIESYCKDIAELTLNSKCSVISMADVLEHIPYPKNALLAAHSLLDEAGVLFLSMPNSENIVWKTLDQKNANPYWGEIEHYHNFSRSRLYALLREFGFEPICYGISERYRVCMEIIAKKI